MEPSASAPWSVLIAIGGTLISGMASIIVALVASRLGRLEKQVEDAGDALHKLQLEATEQRGMLLWLKSNDEKREGDHLPRELVLQRLDGQDAQLSRIEQALDRKVSRDTMAAVRPHRDERVEPESDPPPLPPMRGRLPSTRGR